MDSARPTSAPARARAALAALLLVPLGLAGCAGAPAPVVTATVTVTPTPSPTPTPTATPTPTPVPEAEVVPNPTITPNADAVPVEPLPEGPASDTGATAGATGAPVTDGAGAPVSYTVLEGDDFFAIAQRFNVPMQQLLRMNPSVSGLGEDIYIRDVINLDWTTTG